MQPFQRFLVFVHASHGQCMPSPSYSRVYYVAPLTSPNDRDLNSSWTSEPLAKACRCPCCGRPGCRRVLLLLSSDHLSLELASRPELPLDSNLRLANDSRHLGRRA